MAHPDAPAQGEGARFESLYLLRPPFLDGVSNDLPKVDPLGCLGLPR